MKSYSVIKRNNSNKSQQYQQRLDKVLSKFKKYKNLEILYKNFIEDGAIEYVVNEKEFYWTSYNDGFKISLETVESLLNDLESD